jgi:type IV secretion system protein VirB10
MTDLPPVKKRAVAQPARTLSFATVWGALIVIGFLLFLFLANARAARAQREEQLPSLANAAATTPAPLPEAAPATPAATPPVVQPFVPTPGPQVTAPLSPLGIVAPDREKEHARAPVLIVDLVQNNSQRALPPAGPQQASDGPPGTVAQGAGNSLSNSERFSNRVSKEDVEIVEAIRMSGLNRLVPQGTTIAAVMETALNSDLPGFARAIVQRDVFSFDGTTVLIPAGSRVIGKYESGVAQGASRIFIVWTRLIRPDGVSVSLASPAVDDLGRGGVGGKVNRHFLQRFGGSILLSVLTGGINAATASATQGSSVIVSTSTQASGLATQASRDLDIPPTIKTPQGASVRIFVARDLDFTRVGPVE